MARPQKRYACNACGSVSSKWAGQCADCGAWNSMAEDAGGVVTPFRARHDLHSGGRALEMVGLPAEEYGPRSPFALSGGVFLQKLMGYNFNGAVWVGYIALFGTAVQTGVVMVVYLEEAVKAR